MIRRLLTARLRRAAQLGGVVVLEGPRGAGKTTLLQSEFPGFRYISMESARDRSFARQDPLRFAARLSSPAIVDDVHLAPELARYLARLPRTRPLIVASSLRLGMAVPTLRLYRPTLAELDGRPPISIDMLGHFVPDRPGNPARSVPSSPAYDSIERDLRHVLNFRDLDRFYSFVEIALQESGKGLDFQKLARTAEISRTTAVRWVAILEDCFLVIRIAPSGSDFGRRISRTPKLHFLESNSFESRVVSELYRNAEHTGVDVCLRYWRDSNGLEAQLVSEPAGRPPMGIAIVESPNPLHFSRLRRWANLAGAQTAAMISSHKSAPRSGPILCYTLDQL